MYHSARTLTVAASLLVLAGCAGQPAQLRLKDKTAVEREMTVPKGTLFGKASTEQAQALARLTAESHNLLMAQMSETAGTAQRTEKNTERIDTANQRIEAELKRLEESAQKQEGAVARIDGTTQRVETETKRITESVQKIETGVQHIETAVQKVGETADTAKLILAAVEKLAKKQGSGEITLFFPVAMSRLEKGSLEHQRLIRFLDFLAREAAGRKILFVSVGNASAFGDKQFNERLAKQRSEAPLQVIDQYLVNTPHEYFKVYGTGDVYSPKNISLDEHQRYQSARVIAVFETALLPTTPAQP